MQTAQLARWPKAPGPGFTTLLLSVVTLATGRATALHGVIHPVLLGAFLFLVAVP